MGGTVGGVGTSGCMTWARISLELVLVGVAAVEAESVAEEEEEEEEEVPGRQKRGFRDKRGVSGFRLIVHVSHHRRAEIPC